MERGLKRAFFALAALCPATAAKADPIFTPIIASLLVAAGVEATTFTVAGITFGIASTISGIVVAEGSGNPSRLSRATCSESASANVKNLNLAA